MSVMQNLRKGYSQGQKIFEREINIRNDKATNCSSEVE